MEKSSMEKRLLVLFAVFLGLLVVIVGRLWYLQMIKGEHFVHLADGNRMRQLRVMPPRARFSTETGLYWCETNPRLPSPLYQGS